MKFKPTRFPDNPKSAPIWKRIVVILLVIAMPLFFALVRNNQMQRSLVNSTPQNNNVEKKVDSRVD